MTTRKKKAAKPAEQQELYLSKEDLLRAELAQAKVESAINACAAQRSRVNDTIRDAEAKVHSAQQQLQTMQALMASQVKTAETLWAELTERYSVDFKQVTYDDQTGKINIMPEDTKGEKGT